MRPKGMRDNHERRLTEKEKNQIAAWTRRHVSQTEIATKLGCTADCVRYWQKRLCGDFRYRPPVGAEARTKILELRRLGLASLAISLRTGVSARMVQRILRETGTNIKARRPVSPETRAAIDREILSRADFLVRIARRHNVSVATVRRRKIKLLGKGRLLSTWPPLRSVFSQADAAGLLPTPEQMFMELVRRCIDETAERFLQRGCYSPEEIMAARISLKRDPTPIRERLDAGIREAVRTLYLTETTGSDTVH